jgi:hypothetical protein
MTNGNTPVFLTFLAAGLLAAALFTFQPYSADGTGRPYAKPARRYVRAALGQDSLGLARLSASGEAVAWGLRTARLRHDSLALWSSRARAWIGARAGDTTEVFLYPPGESCGEAPIVLRFVGSGRDARVLSARSACLDPGEDRRPR